LSPVSPELPAKDSLGILFVTPECAPLVKTGGLGDVSAALPAALRAIGLDARVLLPGYTPVLAAIAGAEVLASLDVFGHPVRLLDAKLPNGVPLLVVDCPELYARGGGPYQADDGGDWDDNALRFGVLSKVAATLGSNDSPFDWLPGVVHCNDWPAALAPVYLAHSGGPHAATLTTIHNLAFQGAFTAAQVQRIELPPASQGTEGMEFYGRVSFLKGALVYSDAISTVSPTYAREIQGATLGMGLDGVLRERHDRLFGVLNGIDTALWNPLTDPHIPSPYGPLTLERKRPNKLALKQRLGLQGSNEKPLLGMVSRLTHQKGIDLLLDAADAIVALGAQVVVLGVGDRELAASLHSLTVRHPGDFAVAAEFDEALAHLVEAGADAFLMPSRFEPCGMNQMYSQRYGTPPIANSTGGLIDTVFDDARAVNVKPTGFLMDDTTPGALTLAVERAMVAWKDPRRWRSIQLNGMAKDFGWSAAAREYERIYRKIL
jgi:starch synthase